MTIRATHWDTQVPAYLAHCGGKGQRPSSVAGAQANLRYFVDWCHTAGLTSPDLVTIEHVGRYAACFVRIDDAASPLAAGTRRNRLTAVRLFFRWWSNGHFERSNPLVAMELPKVPRTLPFRGFDRSELRALRRVCAHDSRAARRDRALIEFLLATGLRRAECSQLNLGDLDLVRRWVTVRGGKGGHDRVVPMSEAAVNHLRAMLRPRPSRSSSDPLFLAPRGGRLAPRRMTDLVHRLLARAGIEGRGACHRFRHTLATTMLENGADIRHIQAMLGHADISTTMIYASVLPLELRRVYDRTHPGVPRSRWRKV
jgi:integrase/recombinase XerD